ncbi:response regulator [Pedosphaera parvula]|uniref:Response regulator receiver protein n=1 Tax=Pedosphaera parvula (strain Ellin514) TaxID=320771 RepID=B9XIY2_PEDPL|nr:response regulator [Pedosphaera parvula]EEF60209.1 response regulator receiver protein [Pedosphaera parvula Ellin514]
MLQSCTSVLVLEDNVDDYLLLSIAVKKTALPVILHWVHSPSEALAYLHGEGPFSDRERYPFPCLFLTDLNIRIGTYSGLELIQKIRQTSRYKDLYIAVLSGSLDEHQIILVYEAGGTVFLNKTSAMNELISMMHGLLAQFCHTKATL